MRALEVALLNKFVQIMIFEPGVSCHKHSQKVFKKMNRLQSNIHQSSLKEQIQNKTISKWKAIYVGSIQQQVKRVE